MKRTTHFQPHSVICETREDGTLLLSAIEPLDSTVANTTDWLQRWANETPGRIFLAERSGAGWREESYASVLEQVRAIASSLVARGLNQDTPILIMSGNGIDHALLTLAAQFVGVPTVPVAEQYSLIPGAQKRLQHAIDLVRPAMAYFADAIQYADAIQLDALSDIEVVATHHSTANANTFSELLRGSHGVDIDAIRASLTADTIAKILMTSGSPSKPKGVLTTHKMLCANQAQIDHALPFLRERPPRLLDWLPWNHVFGGSHNFNMMLANGGSLYIDDGKPAPGLFDRTLENLAMVTGTLCFNVPVGFQMLLDALHADTQLQQRFFGELDLIFYSGASLPQEVWEGFEKMALKVKGEVPLMTSSWGLTETAPAAVMQQEPTDRSGVIGVPLPGMVAKLIPDADERCEIRVKGPNITPGYFNAPEKTAAAFDDEGFFISGDFVQFVNNDLPAKGLRFVGRMSEDFKLLSGTWVHAAQLRLDLLQRFSPLAIDLVVTGADRNEIGVLILPNKTALQQSGMTLTESDGALTDASLLAEIHRLLVAHSKDGISSSTRVTRALVVAEPASMAAAEITAKGNLNVSNFLYRRADLLARLYDDTDKAVTTLRQP